MVSRLPRYDDSQVVVMTGALINQIFREIERLSRLQFSSDFQVSQTIAGTNVSLTAPIRPNTLQIDSYADAGGLYLCKSYKGFPYIDPTVDSALPQNNESLVSTADCYLENTPEVDLVGSHYLPIGANIMAIPTGQTSTDNLPIFRIYIGGGVVSFLYNSINADALYNGKTLSGTSTQTSGTAFTAPAGMTAAAANDCLVCSLFESGLVGNRIQLGSYGEGLVVGATSAGLKIIYAQGGRGTTTSPTTLPHGSYGSPDGTTWNRDSGTGAGTPVIFDPFWMGYDATSGNFFMMTRVASYDARGMIYKVSGETQTTIGTTAC
jgi:hypothetical protein